MARLFSAMALALGLFLIPVVSTPAHAKDIDAKELRCLALTLYWEAEGEGREGMMAVAAVVLNRVRHADFPNSVCGVVKQGGETQRHRCQFSWWCDGKSDWPQNSRIWRQAEQVARKALSKTLQDPTDGSLFYHHTAILPKWRLAMEMTAVIGRHAFYR
jgi:spore germination cell wall hydrolase CwlJ-like protein